MAEKRVIAVVGATGAQGGGLVRAILADPSVSVTTGLNQGFRHFDARPGLSHRPLLLTTLNLINAPVLLTRNRRPAATVVTEAQSFLSIQGQTPFFLVVQLADLLPPYDGPAELIVHDRPQHGVALGRALHRGQPDDHAGRAADALEGAEGEPLRVGSVRRSDVGGGWVQGQGGGAGRSATSAST